MLDEDTDAYDNTCMIYNNDTSLQFPVLEHVSFECWFEHFVFVSKNVPVLNLKPLPR